MKYLALLLTLALSLFTVTGCMQDQESSNMQMSSNNRTSHQPVTDTTITAEVKSKFISNELFSSRDIASMSIHVETINGVVYLTGKANRTQIHNAIKLARTVDGVKDVVSKVRVTKNM